MSAALVRKLKENGEDFEYYPTTTEILTALYWDLLPQKREDSFEDNFFGVNKHITLLDIGAGNCKLLSEIISNTYLSLSTTEILTALYWDLLPQKREDSFEDNFFGVNKHITL